jgi:hypothetical protein
MIYLGADSPHHTALGDLCQPDSVAKVLVTFLSPDRYYMWATQSGQANI